MNRYGWITGFVLLMLLAAGLWLRAAGWRLHSLWFDELASLECATGRGLMHDQLPHGVIVPDPPVLTRLAGAPPWWNVWTSLKAEQHPPLYFLLLRMWMELFGQSESAVRSLSTVMGLLAIVFLFDAVRLWHGPLAGLTAAAMGCVSTQMIDQSMQARMYMPMVAFLCIAASALARLDVRGFSPGRAGVLASGLFGAMLTHYFALGACLALFLYSLTMNSATRRRVLWWIAGAGALYLVVWGPFFYQQVGNFELNRGYLSDKEPGGLWRAAERLILMPTRMFYEPSGQMKWVASMSAVLYILPFLLIRRCRPMLLWGLWLGLTVLLLLLLDLTRQTRQLSLPRYALGGAPALFAMIAGLPLSPRPWVRVLIPLLFCIGSVAAVSDAYRRNDGDFRPVARFIDNHAGPRDLLVFASASHEGWSGQIVYLNVAHYLERSRPIMILDLRAEPAAASAIRNHQPAWLVAPWGNTLPDRIPGANILLRFEELFSAGVHWIEFSPPRPEPAP
jgi:uncharacterized membrane protein